MDVQADWLGVRTPEAVDIDVPVKDGDKLLVGATEVHVLHTPGHTQGSICLWMPAERKLVAGDTLFRDSIGRTDLPGGDGRQILQSIHDQLLPLPGETRSLPRPRRADHDRPREGVELLSSRCAVREMG